MYIIKRFIDLHNVATRFNFKKRQSHAHSLGKILYQLLILFHGFSLFVKVLKIKSRI